MNSKSSRSSRDSKGFNLNRPKATYERPDSRDFLNESDQLRGKYKNDQLALTRFREIDDRLDDAQHESQKTLSRVEGLGKTSENLQANVERIEEKANKLDDQLRGDKLQSIQILAVFVALFTFVSVEFQLFSTMQDSQAVLALTLILLGSLLFFVSVIMRSIGAIQTSANSGGWSWLWRWGIVLISLLLVLVGSYCLYMIKEDQAANLSLRSGECRSLETEMKIKDNSVEHYSRLAEIYENSKCGSVLQGIYYDYMENKKGKE